MFSFKTLVRLLQWLSDKLHLHAIAKAEEAGRHQEDAKAAAERAKAAVLESEHASTLASNVGAMLKTAPKP
jgi:hypothetical protein